MAFAYIATAYADSDEEDEGEDSVQLKGSPESPNPETAGNAKSDNHHYSSVNTHNFFGIESDSDSESNSASYGTKFVKSDKSPISLPNSRFWQKKDSRQFWDKPEKIWKHLSNDVPVSPIYNKGKPKRHGDNASDNANEGQLIGYNKKAKFGIRHSQVDTTMQPDPLSQLRRKCFFVHHKVTPYLHKKSACHIPPSASKTLRGHSGAVNRVVWNVGEYSHLLLSVSMDRSVKIWNAFSKDSSHVQESCHHTKAVKDGKWVNQGKHIITCGYDNMARLYDVEKGSEVMHFSHKSFLTSVECHSNNPNYFMCGSLNSIICWDLRSNSHPVRTFTYKEPFGQVQSIQFVNEGREFFICNDMVSRDSSDKNIMVWDFLAGVVLSNQVYHERYTCTRLKANPSGGEVLAQTNGDYVALFSTIRPYKMNKCKRFEGHKVQGFGIGCDMSPDGQYVISGSADTQLYIYDYRTSRVLRTLSCDNQVCMDVAWHPHIPGAIAASTWGGDIKVWS